MTVAITRRPTGTVTAKLTALHLKADDVTANNTDGTERLHYMTMECTGQPTLTSQLFSGNGEWNNIIPTGAGSWTAHLRETDGDSVANLAITVS